MMTDAASIKQYILDFVHQSPEKIPPSSLEKVLRTKFSLAKKEAKALIKEMIDDEALAYTYHFGNTYLERSFDKPVRISANIILVPPRRSYSPQPGEAVIKMESGVSFGSGAHPTTRLCLRAMAQVLAQVPAKDKKDNGCLDIGTGSGVLVIGAVKLGMAFGMGLDMDPNALSEARNNVAINELSDCIEIDNISLYRIHRPFFLIMANLRPPTLLAMAKEIGRLSAAEGWIVLSGFRPEEQEGVETGYTEAGFCTVFQEAENGWACLALKKRTNV